jgi:hypothetical protein
MFALPTHITSHASSHWPTDNFLDLTWVLKKGQAVWIRVYGTNYAYHSGNANGAHSRVQVTYEGKSTDMDVPN